MRTLAVFILCLSLAYCATVEKREKNAVSKGDESLKGQDTEPNVGDAEEDYDQGEGGNNNNDEQNNDDSYNSEEGNDDVNDDIESESDERNDESEENKSINNPTIYYVPVPIEVVETEYVPVETYDIYA